MAVFFWCHPGPSAFLRGFSILSSLTPHFWPAPLLAVGLFLHPWQASRGSRELNTTAIFCGFSPCHLVAGKCQF
jgi:hypothetical protein